MLFFISPIYNKGLPTANPNLFKRMFFSLRSMLRSFFYFFCPLPLPTHNPRKPPRTGERFFQNLTFPASHRPTYYNIILSYKNYFFYNNCRFAFCASRLRFFLKCTYRCRKNRNPYPSTLNQFSTSCISLIFFTQSILDTISSLDRLLIFLGTSMPASFKSSTRSFKSSSLSTIFSLRCFIKGASHFSGKGLL